MIIGQILVAGPLDPAGGDDACAVDLERQQRHIRFKPLLPERILGLSRDNDPREIQHIHLVQQEIHLVVSRQPITW